MTIYINKKRAVKSAVLMVFCSLLFIFLAFFDIREIGSGSSIFDNDFFYWAYRILCIILLPFILYATGFYFYFIFSKKPLVEVTPEALIDNSSLMSLGKILWSDMEFAFVKGAFFSIILKEPEKYLKEASLVKRILIKLNMKWGFGEVCISPILFEDNFLEFLKCFNRYMPIPEIMEMIPTDPNEKL